MTDGFIYEPYENGDGVPMWSCRRPGSGIAGYGYTQKQALEDFLDKEELLVPPPKTQTFNHCPDQPPESRPMRGYREEDHE